eukprot:3645017-Rhodomonas_salina.1
MFVLTVLKSTNIARKSDWGTRVPGYPGIHVPRNEMMCAYTRTGCAYSSSLRSPGMHTKESPASFSTRGTRVPGYPGMHRSTTLPTVQLHRSFA